MATTKTTTLTFRIEPNLKEALRVAAENEHRSIANMVEVMILEYCARVGVAVAEKQTSAKTGRSATSNQKKPVRVNKIK